MLLVIDCALLLPRRLSELLPMASRSRGARMPTDERTRSTTRECQRPSGGGRAVRSESPICASLTEPRPDFARRSRIVSFAKSSASLACPIGRTAMISASSLAMTAASSSLEAGFRLRRTAERTPACSQRSRATLPRRYPIALQTYSPSHG